MRIALVCPYAFDDPGRVQTHVRELAEYLIRHGHAVEVLAPLRGRERSHYVHPVGRPVDIPYNASNAPIDPRPWSRRRVAAALVAFAPDVVHVHEPLAPSTSMWATLEARVPVVGDLPLGRGTFAPLRSRRADAPARRASDRRSDRGLGGRRGVRARAHRRVVRDRAQRRGRGAVRARRRSRPRRGHEPALRRSARRAQGLPGGDGCVRGARPDATGTPTRGRGRGTGASGRGCAPGRRARPRAPPGCGGERRPPAVQRRLRRLRRVRGRRREFRDGSRRGDGGRAARGGQPDRRLRRGGARRHRRPPRTPARRGGPRRSDRARPRRSRAG